MSCFFGSIIREFGGTRDFSSIASDLACQKDDTNDTICYDPCSYCFTEYVEGEYIS